jgi:hypothetical protein
MICKNPACGKSVADGANFCPYCATDQRAAATGGTAQRAAVARDDSILCLHCGKPFPAGAGACPNCSARQSGGAPGAPKAPPTAQRAITVRATENIWDYTEVESPAPMPGRPRVLPIVDEQVTHLAHTDRHLTSHELLLRVQSIIEAQRVPVDVQEVPVSWQNDRSEGRPRVIASLRDHAKSNLKMILGVDYLGDWASIVMQIAMEPDPIPTPSLWTAPMDAVIALIVGVILLLIGGSLTSEWQTQGAGVGLLAIGGIAAFYGAVRLGRSRNDFMWQMAKDRKDRDQRRLMEEMARTYKVDDARLFCAAMQAVFKAVVDDIVEKGGEVVRVHGGQGGYFDTPDLGQPTARRTDAALAEV